VFVTLKTSKVNFIDTRSVNCVDLMSETSARRCQLWAEDVALAVG